MKSSLSSVAYEYIANAIASGEIEAGSIVSEQALATSLNISRTPVREAIRRLQHEGIVEPVPRYGTIVRPPDRTRLRELFELREALECYAIERAVERISPASLAELGWLAEELGRLAHGLRDSDQTELKGEELQSFLEVDMGFHVGLLQAAGNLSILKTVNDSRALAGIFGVRREAHDLSVLARSYLRHTQIFRAVKAGDAQRARKLLAAHIRESRRNALDHYDHTYSQPANQLLHDAVMHASLSAAAGPGKSTHGREEEEQLIS